MKRTIRLRESELRRMVSESVRRVLKETQEDEYWDELDKQNYKDMVYLMCELISKEWGHAAATIEFMLENEPAKLIELMREGFKRTRYVQH
jgi:hypothetical protein